VCAAVWLTRIDTATWYHRRGAPTFPMRQPPRHKYVRASICASAGLSLQSRSSRQCSVGKATTIATMIDIGLSGNVRLQVMTAGMTASYVRKHVAHLLYVHRQTHAARHELVHFQTRDFHLKETTHRAATLC
jgi:hypothetical protein